MITAETWSFKLVCYFYLTRYHHCAAILRSYSCTFLCSVMWVMKYSPSSYQVKRLEAHGTSQRLSLRRILSPNSNESPHDNISRTEIEHLLFSLSLCMSAHVCICNDPAHPHICIQALTVHLSVVVTAPWRLLFSPWWGEEGDVFGKSVRNANAGEMEDSAVFLLWRVKAQCQREGRKWDGDGAFSRRLVQGSTSVCWAKTSSLIKSADHLKRKQKMIEKD